jgi:putative transposase
VSAFIEANASRFGVEPICRVLAVAPSSHYAARSRPPSARAIEDAGLRESIGAIHAANHGVYGVRKMGHALRRAGRAVGRDRVARLMRELGLRGVTRSRTIRTTLPADPSDRPTDLVGRVFSAPAPDRLWVADITFVPRGDGFCYAAFVIDAFARRIVGWRVADRADATLVMDALEHAAWSRGGRSLEGLVHHSDRGVQYLSLRYTDRLAELGALVSVGSVGDSYDNALAETVNGLYKAELIHRSGPWTRTAQVELATAGWIHWWNGQRLHSALGYIPPAEAEATYWRRRSAAA